MDGGNLTYGAFCDQHMSNLNSLNVAHGIFAVPLLSGTVLQVQQLQPVIRSPQQIAEDITLGLH